MPIYEYQCRECGYRLDALQKISDPQLSDCPECRQPALKKLVSAPHFRLKGSGWYETDFKHGGAGKSDQGAESGESKALSEGGKDSEGSKDSGESKTESSGSGSAKESAATEATAS